MNDINLQFDFWKVTDGLDNPIMYSKDKEIAEIHYYRRDRKYEPARLYCCVKKQWLSDEEQEWTTYDYNCDLTTGNFIERTTVD